MSCNSEKNKNGMMNDKKKPAVTLDELLFLFKEMDNIRIVIGITRFGRTIKRGR